MSMRNFEPPFRIDESNELFDAKGSVGKFADRYTAEAVMYSLGLLRYAVETARKGETMFQLPDDPSFKKELAEKIMEIPWDDLKHEMRMPGLDQYRNNFFVKWGGGKFWIADWSGHLTCTPDIEVVGDLTRLESVSPENQGVRSILMASTIGQRIDAYNELRAKLRRKDEERTSRYNTFLGVSDEEPTEKPTRAKRAPAPRGPVVPAAELTLDMLGLGKKKETE